MERTPVSSTSIAAIGYDVENYLLEVEFVRGAVYLYSGVLLDERDGFMSSDSKGKYFYANIRNRYSCNKL